MASYAGLASVRYIAWYGDGLERNVRNEQEYARARRADDTVDGHEHYAQAVHGGYSIRGISDPLCAPCRVAARVIDHTVASHKVIYHWGADPKRLGHGV